MPKKTCDDKVITNNELYELIENIKNNMTLSKIINNEADILKSQKDEHSERLNELKKELGVLKEKNSLYQSEFEKKDKLRIKIAELEEGALTIQQDKITEYNKFKKDLKKQYKSMKPEDVTDEIKNIETEIATINTEVTAIADRLIKLSKAKLVLEI